MSFPVVLSLVLMSIALIVLLTSLLKHNTFLSMFIVSLLLGIIVLPARDVVPIITQGFGDTMKSIGVIILLGDHDRRAARKNRRHLEHGHGDPAADGKRKGRAGDRHHRHHHRHPHFL